LGFYIFKWARELFSNKAGILALFLFSFSPTFLAHGRLVTTDVGAAFGVLVASYYFIRVLKSPSKKNIILAGVFFGIAQLLKFSVILLLPFFVLLAFIWWLVKLGKFRQTLKILVLVFFLGFLLIWPIYQYHVLNYPVEKQVRDSQVYLENTIEPIKSLIIWSADKPFLRAYAYYFTGLSMVFQRVVGGNTTFFLGEVSNQGWKSYFPIVYAIKVPLAFHILTIISLLYAVWLIRLRQGFGGQVKKLFQGIKRWIRAHFAELAML
ncbi:unnamed protein product, partial [marine sediment metagenome]